MEGKVELSGMEFHAFHGCFESERREGNLFKVDLSFRYDVSAAAQSDDLEAAVDYGAVYDVVAREMAIPSNLLENVAWRIREAVSAGFCKEIEWAIDVDGSKFDSKHPGRLLTKYELTPYGKKTLDELKAKVRHYTPD